MRLITTVLALALALCLAPAGSAQQPQQPGQPQRDVFQGQFGVMEIALPPGEAARQAKLLNDTLAALPPQRPGVTDVYVLSVAFWGDPVFEREASSGGQILAEHFGAQDRMVVLTNGGAPLASGPRRYPAASPGNLQIAIGRIGQVIDPAEDLVVLFITSHGASDGTVSIMERNRLAGSLRPAHLRSALLDAGIRNRVVIVSACFAGAFIAPLMDERTIVLTAAAPNRASFGCQPSRDWTYFGDAYLNQAIRGGAGLVTGFDSALGTIAQWEREQHLTPSSPQKSVGAAAAQMLARLERH